MARTFLSFCVVTLFLCGLYDSAPAGKNFATVFMQNYLPNYQGPRFQIQTSALYPNTKVTVRVPQLGFTQEEMLGASEGVMFNLPVGVEMIGSKKSLNTVLIEATMDVTVTSLNYKLYTADTSVIYPVTDWGTEYIVFTPSTSPIGTLMEISVTNYKDTNMVSILLRAPVKFEGQLYQSGTTISISLAPYESAQLQSSYDMTGTRVTSKNPVAVSTGHTCTWKFSKCNHVYEQLTPVQNWGKSFLVPPISFQNRYDSVYIQASKPTSVTLETAGQSKQVSISQAQPLEFYLSTPNALLITANEGIQVLFLFNGIRLAGGIFYDPFLINIVPTDLFCTSYTLNGQTGFNNWALFLVRTSELSGLQFDRALLPKNTQWRVVAGSEYSWAQISYAPGAGQHTASHPNSSFGLYSIGTSQMNGYGAPALCSQSGPSFCFSKGQSVAPGDSFWADEDCHKRCYCSPANFQLQCQDSSCQAGEQCVVVDGTPDCQPVSYSTCSATGDPHYLTFDGRRFDFQGTCVYQLVGVCTNSSTLVPFDVYVQNNFRGNNVVSFTKVVQVNVYNISIVISKDNPGKILVNGELTLLPVHLNEGMVSIYVSGWYAVVKTNFNLTVSFDWNSAVFTTVPSTYMNAVCGLCGNYNGKSQDDLIMRNGEVASSPTDLGTSWRVAEIPGCVHGCKGVCPDCDAMQKSQYETDNFCGVIHNPNGPFRDCHGTIDPSNYFEDCVYDVCLYKGSKDVLCQAITAYTSACQKAGIKVYPWRSTQFCNAICPANSHYEVCATGCPVTCYTTFSQPGCAALCQEGCVCNDGFILSGDVCVPSSQCGCVYDERYYNAGDVFFPNGTCQMECTCIQGGKVKCTAFSCGPYETCQLVNGIYKCQPVGTGVCSASGDPHYRTFDGLMYDFQGTCTYVLAKGCGLKGTHLVPFAVMVENEKWWPEVQNSLVSVTTLVAVEVFGYILVLEQNMQGVLVNGVFNYLPLNLNNSALLVYQDGINYVIKTNFGLVITYDLIYHVTVTVPGNYRGKTCGLCGDFNGNKNDDLLLPNGMLAKDIGVFGVAWKVAIPDVVCDDGCMGDSCPKCPPTLKTTFESSSYCGILTEPNGPFAACYQKLDPINYFNDCVFDICASYGNRKVLCDTISAYVYNCQRAGVDIKSWRTAYFCPLPCPANSHYEICGGSCQVACADLEEIVDCSPTCTEGCACDPGFVFNGQACVLPDECSCYENGRTYKPGEVVYEDNCQQKCTCDAVRGLICEAYSCPAETKCLIKKGHVGCYYVDPCKSANCRVKEKCQVEKDEAVCVPLYTGTCWAWGDPHYRTFDGYSYDFQGTCTYTLSTTCGNLTGLVPFTIVERNDNRGSTTVSYVRDIEVFVYGFNITIIKYQIGRILVNSEVYNLPVQLNHGQVTVSHVGNNAVLKTDFGLYVSFDWNWEVIVQLPSSYYNSTCGLCGNFNGNSGDDMEDPKGNAVSSVINWAKSWRVDDPQNLYCWDTCEKDCPTCDNNLIKIYETEVNCGALTVKVNGFFQQCHAKVDPQTFMNNCVYDMCHNNGDRKLLCQAMASYNSMCLQAGIVLSGWRETFDCPMNCQPYSHYEPCTSPCPLSCPLPAKPPVCNGTCVEACVCDNGFVLSAGQCVLPKTCGCSYQGRYYKPQERFWTEGCQQECECDPDFQTVVCWDTVCKPNELCNVEDGVRACRPITYSSCTAYGDPHYRTFDGYYFSFQGTCVYQMVALCSESPGLTPFNVTVQNNNRGSKAVAYTKVVTLELYGIVITISIDYPYKILVDGQAVSLPIYIDNDKLVAFRSGSMAVVKTGFGLQVAFDWNSLVQVTLPSTYVGAVCGLCGNYNGNSTDDRAMRNGTIASSEEQLGASWQTGLTPGCSHQCVGPSCQKCVASQMEVYDCSLITNAGGPFWKCHATVDPKPYQEDCVFDACQYKGYSPVICNAIAAYASACQNAGITIGSWRTSSFCPPQCPKNSHYELCSLGCPNTCANLPIATSCHLTCTEGCQCDEGYMLSGEACVPVSQCGCTYAGRYFRQDEVFFYPPGQCQKRCRCGANGAISCDTFQCGFGEACQLVNGEWGCHPTGKATCVASGDPHYTSFDGRRFDFQGTCVYTLSKTCNDSLQLVPFAVEEENEAYGNGQVAVTKSVAVLVYGYTVIIKQGVRWQVLVDGEQWILPLSLAGGQVTVNQQGFNVILQTDFGLQVLYDTVYYVAVTVPSSYQGIMCGLCGNYNGNNLDDFLLPDGKQASSVDVFGSAWSVGLPQVICSGCGGQCPVCSQKSVALYSGSNFCGIISSAAGPFANCHSKVAPEPYFNNCVFDVCALDGDTNTLCKSVQAYSIACQNAGIQIEAWRNDSFCPVSCPENSHYEMCADTCSTSCSSLVVPSTCGIQCFEGCQCDPGFASDGDMCVPMDSCGCIYEGQYLKVGQSIVNKECSSKCMCHATGGVVCEEMMCYNGQVCGVRDGVQGCHVKLGNCTVKRGAVVITFNGLLGIVNGSGAFEIASLCDQELQQWFRVVVELCSKGGVPSVSAVYVFYLDTTIILNSQQFAWVNGKKVRIPSLIKSEISIQHVDKLVVIQLSTNLRISYSANEEVEVSVTGSLAGKACGACGNYGGDSSTGLTLVGGVAHANVTEAFGSWRASDLSGCCV